MDAVIGVCVSMRQRSSSAASTRHGTANTLREPAHGCETGLQQCQPRPPSRPHDAAGSGEQPCQVDGKLHERTKGPAGPKWPGGSRPRREHWHPPGLSGISRLFTIYLPGLFGRVEDKIPGTKALSFVDVAWLAEGEHEAALSETLERAAKQPRGGRTRTR